MIQTYATYKSHRSLSAWLVRVVDFAAAVTDDVANYSLCYRDKRSGIMSWGYPKELFGSISRSTLVLMCVSYFFFFFFLVILIRLLLVRTRFKNWRLKFLPVCRCVGSSDILSIQVVRSFYEPGCLQISGPIASVPVLRVVLIVLHWNCIA